MDCLADDAIAGHRVPSIQHLIEADSNDDASDPH
jgi:hypothetical protein